MDKGTITGLVAAVILIFIAVAMGGKPLYFINIQSILIVVGGGVFAVPMIAFPFSHIRGLFDIISKAFWVKHTCLETSIASLVALTQKARRESLLALENVEISDPFLKKGVMLAVDGTEWQTIEVILSAQMYNDNFRHERGILILTKIGDYAPAFGMIGTLIGLVNMLTNMTSPDGIGPDMALAILTTLYGALIANVVALPLADKLDWYHKEEMVHMKVTLEGIKSMMSGEHPSIAEQKLQSFLPPAERAVLSNTR